MKFIVLQDNTAPQNLIAEWGFAVYIEYNGHKILLDAGQTGVFVNNARALGVKLDEVELAVLSHGHYDHANGFTSFFKANTHAKLYVSANLKENCYRQNGLLPKYIGIRHGFLREFKNRLVKVQDVCSPIAGMYIVPHSTSGLEEVGRVAKMYKRNFLLFKTEDFSHEQSLVFEVSTGLVIFSSCSHAGAEKIIAEVKKALPGKAIVAFVGGLHLHKSTDEQILVMRKELEVSRLKTLYTGHCTGDNAINLLGAQNKFLVQETTVGLTIEVL